MKSLLRIGLIGKVTALEAIRHRVLNVLLVFALLVMGSAYFLSQLSFDQQIQFIKDFSFGAMTLVGVIMAIVAVAQLVPNEIENRTLFTILAKPIRRTEFLIGKFFGISLVLVVMLGIMASVFGIVLGLREKTFERQITTAMQETTSLETKADAQETLEKVRAEVRDPYLIMALVLIYGRWLLVAAIALLISTFATSTFFTVVTTTLIYILGHLQGTAREIWLQSSIQIGWLPKTILMLVSLFIPDFQSLTSLDAIVVGTAPSWGHLFFVLGYIGVYLVIVMGVASLIFSNREW